MGRAKGKFRIKSWFCDQRARVDVWLVQCDLAAHSAWFEKQVDQGGGIPATDAKRTLSEKLKKHLEEIGFAEVFWRGDGGLYAAPKGVGWFTANDAVGAARKIREVFSAWQTDKAFEKLSLSEVGLRLSCHVCDLWISASPAFWSAPELNLFLKYERELSLRGAIAITHPVFTNLDTRRSDFDYEISKPVRLADGSTWRVYYDKTVPASPRPTRALEWFERRFGVKPDHEVAAVANASGSVTLSCCG